MEFRNKNIQIITIFMIGVFLFNQIFIGVKELALTPYDGLSYTLISSAFIHGDLFHLFINSIVFYWLSSRFIEMKTFLIVFSSSLLASSLVSLLFIMTISPGLVVGASGAIFGMFAYIFFRDKRVNEFFINFIIMNIVPLIIGMNIAWYAHLGGAIMGYLYFRFGPKEKLMWIVR